MIELAPVRQAVSEQKVANVSAAVRNGLNALPLAERVRPGMRVAVAVGSRGISCYTEVAQAVIESLQTLGADPFLVPAMGSHGGGTAAGQQAVLVSYGMAELGVPIRSSLEVKQIGTVASRLKSSSSLPSGASESCEMPIYWDRHAAAAEAVIPINRVKAHTAFHADHESGLCKILTIGLGKKRGAETLHAHDAATAIPLTAQVILEKMPVVAGVAIVENGRHAPAEIAVLPGEQILEEEPQLLQQAKAHQPRIPFDDLDLLIVQEMGKDISGTGMDTNVVGMWRRNGGPKEPDYRVLTALDLTPASHGNAAGVGMADLIPERLRAKIDWHATYTNCATAGNFSGAKQPMSLMSDREVIETGLMGRDVATARVAWIQNTLELETLWLSPALLDEANTLPTLTPAGPAQAVQFTADGTLLPPALEAMVP